QGDAEAIASDLRRFKPYIEARETLDELVLIVREPKVKTVIVGVMANDITADDRTEVLFGVKDNALGWRIDERNPSNVEDFINHNNVLSVASLHHFLHGVVFWTQLNVEPPLDFVGFVLIELFTDQFFHLVANGLAEPGFVAALNLDSFDGVAR